MFQTSRCPLLVFIVNAVYGSIPFIDLEKERAWEHQALCLMEASNGSYYGASLQNSGAVIQGSTLLFYSVNLSEPAKSVFSNYLKLLPEFDTDFDDSIVTVNSDSETHINLLQKNPPESFHNLISRTNKYVLIIDSLALLRNIFRRFVVQRKLFNPSALFVVFYNNLFDSSDRMTAHLAADLAVKFVFEKYMIYKLVFFFASSSEKLEAFIPKIFDSPSCGKIDVNWIGTCENGNLSFTSDVMQKAINPDLNRNCTFKVCNRVSQPHMNPGCLDGMEKELVKEIYQKDYFRWNESCSFGLRGDLLSNGTWTGFLGQAFESKCDIMVGGFFPDDEVNQFFTSTKPYFSDSYYWYAKTEKLPAWQKIFYIFERGTGLLIVLVVVVSSVVWYCFEVWTLRMSPKIDYCLALLNAVAIMTAVSVKQPKRSSFRILTISMAIFSLVISSIFTSKLVTTFTNPGEQKQIETIQDAIHEKIPIGGANENHDWFINELLIYSNFNTSADFIPTQTNFDSVRRGEKIILGSVSHVDTYANRSKFYALPGRVFTSPLQIIMRKVFPLRAYFTGRLSQLTDFGLVAKIEQGHAYNISYLRKIRERVVPHQRDRVILTTHHLSVAFAVLIAGLSLSFFVFVVEVERDRDKRLQEKLARAEIIERKRRARRTLRTISWNMFKKF